jgi:hypothetical protein
MKSYLRNIAFGPAASAVRNGAARILKCNLAAIALSACQAQPDLAAEPTETMASELAIPGVLGIEWKPSGSAPDNTVSVASCWDWVFALRADGTVFQAKQANDIWRQAPARMRMDGTEKPNIFCDSRFNDPQQFYVSVGETHPRQVWLHKKDAHGNWGYYHQFTITEFSADSVTFGNIATNTPSDQRFSAIAHDGGIFSSPTGAPGTWSRLGTVSGVGHQLNGTKTFDGGNTLSVFTADKHLYVGTGNDSQWTWLSYLGDTKQVVPDLRATGGFLVLQNNTTLWTGFFIRQTPNNPPPPGAVPMPPQTPMACQPQVFNFCLMCPSDVTPMFTVQQPACDLETARQLAQLQGGNCSISDGWCQ